jgi:uncharacterized phage-associated protein
MAVQFQFDLDKTIAAITYLASRKVARLDKYTLSKLIVLADKAHLVRYGRTITGDTMFALPHGPIPTRTLDLLNSVEKNFLFDADAAALAQHLKLDRKYSNPHFHAEQSSDEDALSDSDRQALDEVLERYGNMGFDQLKSITHGMYAFQAAWNRKPEGSNSARINFEDLFQEESDAIEGAFDAMIEDAQINAVLRD